jgi:hypothetical protein
MKRTREETARESRYPHGQKLPFSQEIVRANTSLDYLIKQRFVVVVHSLLFPAYALKDVSLPFLLLHFHFFVQSFEFIQVYDRVYFIQKFESVTAHKSDTLETIRFKRTVG